MPSVVYTITMVVLYTLVSTGVLAQDVFIYPQKGQSEEQQSKDRFECHTWAVQQTGFDPSNPPPVAQTQQAPSGGAGRGAARGAAIGAVAGAIAGNAGRGAAIGAGTGAVGGAARRSESQQHQQQQQAAAQQQQAQDRADYDRALSACLEGRGYTVK